MEAFLADPDLPLPSDVTALQELVRQLLAEVRRLRQENAQLRQDDEQLRRDNEQLRHRLDGALRRQFGRRSERAGPRRREPGDGGGAAAPRPGHGRQPLPAHLPRRRVEYAATEAGKRCSCCGGPRVCIGEQVSEQLDYEPASYCVVQHVRQTWACRSCDGPSERRFATTGPAVVGPIPKGLPGPGLLARLITCKYADHLPLHRLEGIVARSGVALCRSTLCDWMAQAAALLGPLAALMRDRVLLSRVIHSDDTSVPFLGRGRDKARDGHLWVYIGDRRHPYAVFDFTAHYRRDGPEQFLEGFEGYLQADALAQYEGLFASGRVAHVACWAHARRRFVEAQGSAPDEAEEALKYIRKLYKVERELAGRFAADDDAGRQQYRAAQTAAAREEFRAWLAGQQAGALPKSPLGEAVRYALSHWEALARYTEQGYLSIDNNLSERTLRQVVVGRANWQFCGSAAGGEAAAALYSAVATCKHLGLDPFAYLRELLPALHALGDSPHAEALGDWLPDAWQRRQQSSGVPPAVPA
jgi:transposase